MGLLAGGLSGSKLSYKECLFVNNRSFEGVHPDSWVLVLHSRAVAPVALLL